MKDGHGELSEIGLPRLLHLIYLKKDDAAVLDIIKEPIKKRFFFRRGLPVAASSNILGEVLGRLLMQEGIISQKEYESSLEVVLKEKKRHGEVLISMGLITHQQLEEFLRLQLKRRLLKIFDWNDGSYRYMKTTLPQNLPHNPLHPAELILEGISLGFYPVSKIKTGLKPYMDKKLAPSAIASYKLDDFRLNLQEKRFVEALKGEGSLEEALASSDLLRHRAISIAMSLILTGVLKDRDGAESEPAYEIEESKEAQAPEAQVDSKLNSELLFMRAKTALQHKDYRSAIEILKEITNLSPGEGEYWAALGWAIYNDDPGRVDEAERLIKDSIDLNNDLDSAWLYLGRLSAVQGKADWARKAFSTALSKNPWNTEALSEIKKLELGISPPAGPLETSLTGGQAAALELLAKAVRKRSGPALIEGEEGSGKTTVLLELLNKLSQDKVLAAVLLKPHQKEIDLIKEINLEVGSQSEATTVKEQLLSLGMRVSQNKIQGGQNIILIDRADELSTGCLKLIQYLTRLKTLQIILFSRPGLSRKLKELEYKELDERLACRITVGNMTGEETASFLEERLKAFGHSGCFSIPEMEGIFAKTGGNPAAVLNEAKAIVERAGAEASHLEKEEWAEEKPLEESGSARDVIEIGEEGFSFEPPQPTEEIKAEEIKAEEVKEETPDRIELTTWEEPHVELPVEEKKREATPVPSVQKAPSPPAQRPLPPREAPRTAPEPKEEAAPEVAVTRRRRGLLKLILWVIVMLAAGLAAGSLIGTYWFDHTEEPAIEQVVPPRAPSHEPPPPAPEAPQEPLPPEPPSTPSLDRGAVDGK
ncbi:MAG TPA: hypothetical protein DDW94_06820 [Deltaproteobacteria bacterium]|nr:MAG: hypothetical protein A2Z79_01350 [Deltaproteobacteria bacterium GWA2_55_82]OGQ62065.1 MAG: hypothetical protein A3I81_03855 [Deltaproteobacteria bacterium RIFCSPLOWO2_02_FULL_55_12]OIJ74077.1 MAG: hypothetical protein A2V21_307260 [Deltaproteobacteria bacterium GWC2_55_46]HBG46690.1 hypothetical protein [Deltaproteobacteria bacterium]HCY11302.1 hypothetical protein [Deltaproteobacteria bacterium]